MHYLTLYSIQHMMSWPLVQAHCHYNEVKFQLIKGFLLLTQSKIWHRFWLLPYQYIYRNKSLILIINKS